MRVAFWLFVLVVAAALALFAASNRESVTLGLWPLPFLIELPLYLLVLTALVLGFIFGQFTAWVAAGRWRREVRRRGRYIAALERELNATQARLAPPASADGAAPVVRP